MKETLYKVLGAKGQPYHGGSGEWNLPNGKKPGKWMPEIEVIQPCVRGYHLCRVQDLSQWLGPRLFVAEAKGNRIDCSDKIVVGQARLLYEVHDLDRKLRLFACDCATRALKIAKVEDERSWKALEVARRFANGKATCDELAAARAAAWAAAGAAARDAARYAAGAAAWAAAGAAAWAAAGAAAWDAAWDAEREWQSKRLEKLLK
jgi:hypothetical protein